MAYPTHRECANFRDGRCLLFGIEVDPDAPACPNFTPRASITPGAPSPQAELWRIRMEIEGIRRSLSILEARLRRLGG